MRLELIFELEKPELPKDNKRLWISFLKQVLTKCHNGQFYEKYFGDEPKKDYTFSVYLVSPNFVGEKILLGDCQMKMFFSSDDRHQTGLIFYQAFISAKQKRFPLPEGNGMRLKKINPLREHFITSTKAIFRTVVGGGLVVRDHNKETNRDKFLTFQDEGFEEQFGQVLALQAEKAGFGADVGKRIKFQPIQCKKVLVKQYGIFVDVTCGIFLLEGKPEFLQYLYQAGTGGKHSMGYGMIDLVTQEF